MKPRAAASGRPLLLLLTFALGAAGCIATAAPRFPPDVAAAIASRPMRKLETPDLEVYYPEARKAEAERFAGWVGGCVRDLRRWTPLHNVMSRRKPFVVLPEQAINNAFVMAPSLGFETASVVTSHSTFDFLVELGMPPDPALFGCHEMVHWAQMMQIGGFFWFIDLVFGDIITPQIGLDPWFHEGIATLYESRLQQGHGRIGSPFWEGAFHAGIAGHRVNGGDLSFAQRKFTFSNHYLVGSRFLAFLVERYGEAKLWELVRKQATSFFFPLWVNLRFWQVYDKTLSTLLDEFADDVARRYPVVARPPEQRPVRALGHSARYATAPDGSEAIVSEGFEDPVRLSVYAPDGRLVRQRSLREVLPLRTLVEPATTAVSGLSFTADGAQIYFALIDQGAVWNRVRLVRYDVAADDLRIAHDDLGGPGGAIAPDGRSYYFARAKGDRHELARLELHTGQMRTLAGAPGVFYGAPRPSPDGKRLVATVAVGNRVHLALLDAASGLPVGRIEGNGNTVDPWFVDQRRVLFVDRAKDDRLGDRFQVFLHDTAGATTTQVSHAPYLALSGRPVGNKLRFLDREGWTWSLDEVALPAAAAEVAAREPAEAPTSATPPPAPGPAPPVVPAQILEDAPYAPTETLFVPQLRGFSFTGFSDGRSAAGLALGGGDRLGQHRWALGGFLDVTHEDALKPSGTIGYVNSQLAPVTLALAGSYFSWWGALENPPPTMPGVAAPSIARSNRTVSLGAFLPFYTHEVSLVLHGSDERRAGDPDEPARRRLGGATASLFLLAIEPAPFIGVRRGLALSLDASLFPDRLSTLPYGLADLRGELGTRLPLLSRLTASIDLRARSMAGAPRGTGLLELGGAGAFANLYKHSNRAERDVPESPDLDLVPARFVEPLRGYEDLVVPLDRVAAADLRLTFPIIIDRGFASSLVVLPSFFVRDLELEGFANTAWDTFGRTRTSLHGAAGAAVRLRTVFWLIPLSFNYQVARRLFDDHALVHLFGLGG